MQKAIIDFEPLFPHNENMHRTHKQQILYLLRHNEFVRTSDLFFSYSHTARITELKKDGYLIASCQNEDGIWGYTLLGRKDERGVCS